MLARHNQRFRQLGLKLQARARIDAIADRILFIYLGIADGVALTVFKVDNSVEVSVVLEAGLRFFKIEGADAGLVVFRLFCRRVFLLRGILAFSRFNKIGDPVFDLLIIVVGIGVVGGEAIDSNCIAGDGGSVFVFVVGAAGIVAAEVETVVFREGLDVVGGVDVELVVFGDEFG